MGFKSYYGHARERSRRDTLPLRFSVICYAWYSVIADTTFAHAMQLIVDILLQTVRDHFGLSDDHLNAFVRQFYDRLPASYQHFLVSPAC